MIKTLRITTIVAAILAGLLLVFPIVFGVRSDGKIEELLKSPGVIERFKEAAGTKAREVEGDSPLIKQAVAFGLYLNGGPPKPKPVAMPQTAPTLPRPSVPVSNKFKLISTSVYESHPEQSIALIDEPGKGPHWIRQSASVGHLVIEQIKDGVVVIRDGQNISELAVEPRPAIISLLEGSQSGASAAATRPTPTTTSMQTAVSAPQPSLPAPHPTLPATIGPATSAVAIQSPQLEATAQVEEPQVSSDEAAALEKLVEQLANLQRGPKSDKTGGDDVNEQEAAAMMEKLMKEFTATQVSDEEAKKLDGLGKELENAQRGPNLPPPHPPQMPTRTIRPRRINRAPTR
jgi:hypothetical protein